MTFRERADKDLALHRETSSLCVGRAWCAEAQHRLPAFGAAEGRPAGERPRRLEYLVQRLLDLWLGVAGRNTLPNQLEETRRAEEGIVAASAKESTDFATNKLLSARHRNGASAPRRLGRLTWAGS